MASGDKLYTVNDNGTVKVLKDTSDTNALVKAFNATSEDSMAPTGLEILNPSGDISRITSSGLVLHCKTIANSIYAWIPWILYADAYNKDVDALRLGFDGDGAYYWWTYDRTKIRINSVSLDSDGNILISGGEGSSVARYFHTSGVQCWVPFLLPSAIKNSRLLTVTENNVEKLTTFNSRLLLQRRGYEQNFLNDRVSEVKYPAWHVPLAIKGDSQGVVDVDDYFDWYNYTGTGSHNKLLKSANSLYSFSFTADSATVDNSAKLSSLFSAWIAPTSYWYDSTFTLGTGLNPSLHNVLTKATDNEIIIANNGALSQDITSEYQIPNYRREGYLAVLNAGICASADSYLLHVIGYDANMGFFYYPDSFAIQHNDHAGIQFTSNSYPNLRYAITINTNTAPTYYRAHKISVKNNVSSPLTITREGGEIAAVIQPSATQFIDLNVGTKSYTITDSSYGLSKTVDLNYDSDTGRLIQVDIVETTVEVTSLNVGSGTGDVATTSDISAPTPYYTPVKSSQWQVTPSSNFEITYVRPTPNNPNDYATSIQVTVKRINAGGPSAATINFNGKLALTITKQWQ